MHTKQKNSNDNFNHNDYTENYKNNDYDRNTTTSYRGCNTQWKRSGWATTVDNCDYDNCDGLQDNSIGGDII